MGSGGWRWSREDGNTLALFPAAVMVMFVLASMAIDAALTFSAQRQLADIASAAANDGASALSDQALYVDGGVAIDPVQAADRVATTVAGHPDSDDLHATCTTRVPPDGSRITVSCTGRVEQLISPMRFLGRQPRPPRHRDLAAGHRLSLWRWAGGPRWLPGVSRQVLGWVLARGAVNRLAEQVGVADVTCVLLDQGRGP